MSSTANYDQISSLINREGQFGSLPEKGFDLEQIKMISQFSTLSAGDKITLASQLLSLVDNVHKNGEFIVKNDLFPQTTVGASRIIAVVLMLIPIERRVNYLNSITNIAKQDGIEDNDLTATEYQEVVQASLSELTSLVPKKFSHFLPVIQTIISFILPFIFKRK